MPKLKAPAGASCFAFEGEEYEVKRGRVELPHKAVASALLHGFTEVADDKADEANDADKASDPLPEMIKVPVVEQLAPVASAQGKK